MANDPQLRTPAPGSPTTSEVNSGLVATAFAGAALGLAAMWLARRAAGGAEGGAAHDLREIREASARETAALAAVDPALAHKKALQDREAMYDLLNDAARMRHQTARDVFANINAGRDRR
jgi:hypothetical protein